MEIAVAVAKDGLTLVGISILTSPYNEQQPPQHAPFGIASLMMDCWKFNAEERPDVCNKTRFDISQFFQFKAITNRLAQFDRSASTTALSGGSGGQLGNYGMPVFKVVIEQSFL
jgi:hypothetical protein